MEAREGARKLGLKGSSGKSLSRHHACARDQTLLEPIRLQPLT